MVMRGGGGGREGGGSHGNYRNPCLTLHQPWASLLVYGIKRIEGRSWPAPIRGRLWIHAASKVPEEATVKAIEDFYREIHALNGITEITFPEHYPVSRLLGCVEVVGCVKCEELARWEAVPEGVRLEGQTEYCWLCEQPQKLLIPFEMRGYQRVFNLERKIYDAAVRGLITVQVPLPIKFPLPNPQDPFSLKPGSLSIPLPESKASEVEKSSSPSAAIAGACAVATQFNKKEKHLLTNINQISHSTSTRSTQPKITTLEEGQRPQEVSNEGVSDEEVSVSNEMENCNHIRYEPSGSRRKTREDMKQLPASHAKV